MQILITNTVLLNTGDAAILEGELRVLQRVFGPDIDIRVHDARSEVTRGLYPNLDVRPDIQRQLFRKSSVAALERLLARLDRWVERPGVARFYAGAWLYGRGYPFLARVVLSKSQFAVLQDYASADLIVSTGGTYLVEIYDLEARILELLTAVLLRKPLILYTQSLGPFNKPKYRNRLRVVFNHAAAILLRDERSLEHVRELGVDCNNVHVTADAAFALMESQKSRDIVSAFPSLRIAISVREWAHFRNVPRAEGHARYIESIRALIAHLVIKHRADIVLLSTCQGIPEYKIDDSQIASTLVSSLPPDVARNVAVNCDFHSPTALMDILRDFDLVISTRMHMAILALNAGTPAVAIAYEFKTRELFRELGCDDLALDIETITPEAVIRVVDEVLTNLPRTQNLLRSATLRQCERVAQSGGYVKDAYARHSSKGIAR